MSILGKRKQTEYDTEPGNKKNNYFREIKCLFVHIEKQNSDKIPNERTMELYNFILKKSKIGSIPIFECNNFEINPGNFNSTPFLDPYISNIKVNNEQPNNISDIKKNTNITINIASDFCSNNQTKMNTNVINSSEYIKIIGAVEYDNVLFPGFIITFMIYNSKTIYIDALCSSQKQLIKGASQMLNIINIITSEFNSTMDESGKITSHTLHAMPGTRDFYKKNRFVIMTEEERPPQKYQEMKRIIGGNRKRKTRRKSRRLVIKKKYTINYRNTFFG